MPSLYEGFASAAIAVLNIGGSVKEVAVKAIIGLAAFFIARLITSLMGLWMGNRPSAGEAADQDSRVRPLLGFLRALVWLAAGLVYLENLGIRMSSVLAGLGIGGIAVALAAQSILGDLFSYFIIYLDKPFDEGDFIAFDDISGTVDRIGIKTTKIRALSGELVVVANSVLTGSRIRNYKKMERRRVAFTIGIVLETDRAMIEAVPGIIRAAIEERSSVEFDRAHLKAISPSSLDFESVYYLATPDYVEFMDAHQATLLRIIEEFDKAGIKLAYPTTTVHLRAGGAAAIGGLRSAS
jgi:small-conductance mechanosensitive channel